jgi:hypothetical protein
MLHFSTFQPANGPTGPTRIDSIVMEVTVNKKPLQTNGAKLLVNKYKNNFRIPENINYYSKADYERAEKKYLRFCLNTGMCEVSRGTINIDGDKSRY